MIKRDRESVLARSTSDESGGFSHGEEEGPQGPEAREGQGLVCETDESRRVCEEVSSQTGGICILGFSRGKDSVAAWLYLRRFFKRVIPFHTCCVPHLSFVDESLKYYEDFFGTKIHRFLDGNVLSAFEWGMFQPPGTIEAVEDLDLEPYGNVDIVDCLRKTEGVPDAWCAYGLSMYDNIGRRFMVKSRGPRNYFRRSFYPCFDWHRNQVVGLLQREGARLPKDYLLGNRSLGGVPHYKFLKEMEEQFPDDAKLVERWYPFIKAELARQHFRRKKWELRKGTELNRD